MKESDVRNDIEQKMARLMQIAHDFNATKELSLIIEFKAILKFLRSFCEFVRLQTNDKNARLTERCKNLYAIAGTIINAEEADKLRGRVTDKLLSPWVKNYSDIHLEKLAKVLSELNISTINPALFDNFYRTHSVRSGEFRAVF